MNTWRPARLLFPCAARSFPGVTRWDGITPIDDNHQASAGSALLGRWQLLRADPELDLAPCVRMEFRSDGRLLYTIAVAQREQQFRLSYRASAGMLRTEYAESRHSTTVGYQIGRGDVLILDFSGPRAWFVRAINPSDRRGR